MDDTGDDVAECHETFERATLTKSPVLRGFTELTRAVCRSAKRRRGIPHRKTVAIYCDSSNH